MKHPGRAKPQLFHENIESFNLLYVDVLPHDIKEISRGSRECFDFHCSAVGCAKKLKGLSVLNRLRGFGRCKRCGKKNYEVCKEKIKHVLPARVHKLLQEELENGLTEEAVVHAVASSGAVNHQKMESVEFWVKLYSKARKSRTKSDPAAHNPMDEDDADSFVTSDELPSVSEAVGPIHRPYTIQNSDSNTHMPSDIPFVVPSASVPHPRQILLNPTPPSTTRRGRGGANTDIGSHPMLCTLTYSVQGIDPPHIKFFHKASRGTTPFRIHGRCIWQWCILHRYVTICGRNSNQIFAWLYSNISGRKGCTSAS